MDEGTYLELVNQLKTKFDKNAEKVKAIQEQMVGLKKDIMVAYTLARILDSPDWTQDELEIKAFTQLLRGHLSTVVEDKILCQCDSCKPEEDADDFRFPIISLDPRVVRIAALSDD